jgi:hypothetical protein
MLKHGGGIKFHPNLRFNNNIKLPIVDYYQIILKSSKGLFECYQFSNVSVGKQFSNLLENYLKNE